MKELYEFGAQVQRFCQQQNWRFCFIGGVAVQAWSEAAGGNKKTTRNFATT